MSKTTQLVVGLGSLVVLLTVVVLLREDRAQQPARHGDRLEAPEAHSPAQDPVQTPAPGPEVATDPAPPLDSAPPGEKRDATGELLSDGPAKAAALPERAPEDLDNTPDAATSDAALAEVIARLDAEIAAAREAGDAAEAERLAVRKARLERKRAEGEAAGE